MHINNLTNENQLIIDRNFIDRVKDAKDFNLMERRLLTQKDICKESNQYKMNLGDLNRSMNIKQGKYSELKNVIAYLKKCKDYTFEKNFNRGLKDRKNTKEKDIENLDVDKIERNNNNYIEIKEEMMLVGDKIDNLKLKIAKKANEIYFDPFKENKSKKININNDILTFRDKENTKLKSNNSKSQIKKNSNLSILMSSAFSFNPSFSNINIKNKTRYTSLPTKDNIQSSSYKSKYLELKEQFDLQKKEIEEEKVNIVLLEDKIKQISKKCKNYDNLIEYNKQLFYQDEMIRKQILDSGNIRSQQSKLIKSLTREIDELKGNLE